MVYRFWKIYCKTLIVILSATALLKFVEVYRNRRYVKFPDPVAQYVLGSSSVTNRDIIAVAALLELILVVVLILPGAVKRKINVLASFSAVLCAYRFAHWISGAETLCPCLGSLGEIIGLSANEVRYLGHILFAYIALGTISFAYLIRSTQYKPTFTRNSMEQITSLT
jgi:hypothetical protein